MISLNLTVFNVFVCQSKLAIKVSRLDFEKCRYAQFHFLERMAYSISICLSRITVTLNSVDFLSRSHRMPINNCSLEKNRHLLMEAWNCDRNKNRNTRKYWGKTKTDIHRRKQPITVFVVVGCTKQRSSSEAFIMPSLYTPVKSQDWHYKWSDSSCRGW